MMRRRKTSSGRKAKTVRPKREKKTPAKRTKSRGERAPQTIERRSRTAVIDERSLRNFNRRPLMPATAKRPARSTMTSHDVAGNWPKKENKRK